MIKIAIRFLTFICFIMVSLSIQIHCSDSEKFTVPARAVYQVDENASSPCTVAGHQPRRLLSESELRVLALREIHSSQSAIHAYQAPTGCEMIKYVFMAMCCCCCLSSCTEEADVSIPTNNAPFGSTSGL